MTVRLTFLSGPLAGQIIEVEKPKYLVGREEDCDLRPDSRLVSRHHCAVVQDGYSIRLRDMGSRNGTYVNGKRIAGSVSLDDGDLVSIGEITMRVAMSPAVFESPSGEVPDGANLAMSQTDVFDGETLQIHSAPKSAAKTGPISTSKLPVSE